MSNVCMGVKFTPSQRAAIDVWLRQRGLTVSRPTDILQALVSAALTADGIAYPQDMPSVGGKRAGAGRKAKPRA